MRRSGSVFATVALALFALFLAIAVPRALGRSYHRILDACHHAGETPAEARERVFGLAYTAAVDGIRRTIPPDGSYLLVNGERRDEGGPYWVRYDLAPRRALFLGRLRALRQRNLRTQLTREARWVVIAYADGPPVVMERWRFVAWLADHRRG
jgi:hypothetical protein